MANNVTSAFQEFRINAGDLHVDPNEIMCQLGYDDRSSEPYFKAIVEESIEQILRVAQPACGYTRVEIASFNRKQGVLKAGNQTFHVGQIITSQLREASHLIAFVCTLGELVEQTYERQFRQGNNLEGYIMNLAASEAAENLANQLHNHLHGELASEGLQVTNRFSPGYCNWDVAEQFRLFSIFPPENIGVTLTNSALMQPIKSISGIVGTGQKAKFRSYACAQCEDEHCLYRKTTKTQVTWQDASHESK